MPSTKRAAKSRILAIVAFCGVVAVSAALALASRDEDSRVRKTGAVYRIERSRETYTFDAAWRTESLWTRPAGSDSWIRVHDPDPVRVDPLRRDLLKGLDRGSLGDIPFEGADDLKALQALGYL